MISAVVLSKNEEKNIEKCLKSLLWCEELVIVDDYSDDKTIDIVRKVYKVHKVFKRHLDNDFSSQRNFGLSKASKEWVLFVDADEIVTEELAKEIRFWTRLRQDFAGQASQNDEKTCGFYIKRQDYFLGKWLEYGETGNIKLLRLARKNSGRWSGKVHERWEITGKTADLKSTLLHYSHPTLSKFLENINFYSTIRAEELYSQGKRIGFWETLLYPTAKFLQNYFWRLGFLDGMQGLIMAVVMNFHSFLVRGKLYLLTI